MQLSTPTTSLSLIDRIGHNDGLAWTRLVHLYGPVVYRWCRRRGLSGNDANDVMQEVFVAVAAGVKRYRSGEKGGGMFRCWLHGITSNKINDLFRLASNRPGVMATDQLEETVAFTGDSIDSTDDYSSDPVTEAGDRRIVLRRALEAIQADYTDLMWKAFWRTAVDGQPATHIAEELGIRADRVRQIKFRILKRLRQELSGLEPDV